VISSRLFVVVITGIVATLVWDFPFFLPIKLLVVLVHEIWHAIAALLFNAQIEKIGLNLLESGETVVSGIKSPFVYTVVVSAGYIGSAFTGALFLIRGVRGGLERFSLFIFAFILLYMTHLFTIPKSPASYTGYGWSFLLVIASFAGERTARIALKLLGSLFVWYCMFDLFDFTDSILNSDAGALARFLAFRSVPIAVAARLIAAAWIAIMIAIFVFMLRALLRADDAIPSPPVAEGNGSPAQEPPANFPDDPLLFDLQKEMQKENSTNNAPRF